jgi:streptomycin 6-kinase
MLSAAAINSLESRVVGVFGDAGKRWLTELPALLQSTAQRLSLTLLPPYANLTYNYVAPAIRSDGVEVVLKVGVPCRELNSEIESMRRFSGYGCAEVMHFDSEAGVLVLERLNPGVPLTALANDRTDSEATSIACTVIRALREVRSDNLYAGVFQSTAELGLGFQQLRNEFSGGVGPFPHRLVEEAEQLWSDLESSVAAPILLHGDLHHDNIISAARSPWLAIDPKGYIGDPAFETGPLLRNLWQDRHQISNPARTIERRVSKIAEELVIDRARVRGWALAQAVLSVWWSYEDGDLDWADSLQIAELIAGIWD